MALAWVVSDEIEPADLITPELLAAFAAYAGLPKNEATQSALSDALDAFRGAWFDLDALRPESAENKALEAAAANAGKLYDDLLALQEYPGIEGRLERTISAFPHLYELEDGKTLRDLLGTRRNIFRTYRELLVDLQACLELTINRKPRRQVLDGLDDEDPIDLETDEEHAKRMKDWRARSKARSLPKEHALHAFLLSLRPYWEAHSPYPFTEGMHYKEANQTISFLVDAVEQVMAIASPDTTRAQIVTAIREVRASPR
ncbi:hypothetical protein N3C64_14200 [Sedimentimonas flavescens]|nr:hypothetical protein [Sedimentimonas flavescens]